MTERVVVAGVGMIPFQTPRHAEPYVSMVGQAVTAALDDAGVAISDVQQSFAGYVYGDSASGQRALYEVGMPGTPVVNVNNNCSTGSTALWLANQAVGSGAADCVLAVGFEQMTPGALTMHWEDRASPFDKLAEVGESRYGPTAAPFAAQMFGAAGLTYAERYGTLAETFARIAVKARAHAAHNPRAVFREPVTLDEVLSSPPVFGMLTRLQCCPPTCGAAAAIVMSESFARRTGAPRDVVVSAQSMTTDQANSFEDPILAVGYDMTHRAAIEVYEASGVDPMDVPVVELHDCFTANELISYEALHLTAEGTAERFVHDGENTYGGRVVTNPSGGLLSKGHPLGATGIAQCAELTWQLRGCAGPRQVPGARLALQHNIGLGGAAVVTMYERVSS